jgi:hypothetical protein
MENEENTGFLGFLERVINAVGNFLGLILLFVTANFFSNLAGAMIYWTLGQSYFGKVIWIELAVVGFITGILWPIWLRKTGFDKEESRLFSTSDLGHFDSQKKPD